MSSEDELRIKLLIDNLESTLGTLQSVVTKMNENIDRIHVLEDRVVNIENLVVSILPRLEAVKCTTITKETTRKRKRESTNLV